MTPGQLKRRKRNLTIAASKRAGLSYRQIAAAVGLSATRCKEIFDELEQEVLEKTEQRKIPRNSQFSRN